MKQLTQKLKSGKMQILEVPIPDLKPGMVLVRNYYSVISAGTEGSKVKAARKGYLGKAREKPQQVKQAIDILKSQGPVQTYRTVMKKLDAYSPLGYSCVGEVIDMASDVDGFQVEDVVACGGATAAHAELVAVPVNLCVKVIPCADSSTPVIRGKEKREKIADEYLKMAAYNTLGAIAMQGVRQADLRLGETCAVIGLGLLGQLTAILLRASGVKVIGIDIDQAMVELGRKHCLDLALMRNDPSIESKILEFSNGIGCDGVIITAATDSLDPINFAGAISRKKGNIVVVGAVPAGFDREPHYYKKELTLKMSCSYGPGRYDTEYEEKGHDYPVGYVRWTERRNMQAFQSLIHQGNINISHLTTHLFKLENALKAYDIILEKSEPYIGILIEYDRKKKIYKEKVDVKKKLSAFRLEQPAVTIGFIGAGSHAQSYLLPNIPKNKNVILKGVMDSISTTARSVADRFGFEFSTGKEEDILNNNEINTVFIATRHDSHCYYVKKALEARKNVFVEKPLCLTEKELGQIVNLLKGIYEQKNNSNAITTQSFGDSTTLPLFMIGYNRRFSTLTQILKDKVGTGTMSMIYRINAGEIPSDSWIHDKEIGGGRILGEVCHFVDYLTYINGSFPISVYATAMRDSQGHNDTLLVSLRYENGSIGSIHYFANGSKSLHKEYVEIYSHGITAILNDFRELKIYGSSKPFKKRLISQNKGQKNEVRSFIYSILKGGSSLIPLEELFSTTEVTLKILKSIKTATPIKLE